METRIERVQLHANVHYQFGDHTGSRSDQRVAVTIPNNLSPKGKLEALKVSQQRAEDTVKERHPEADILFTQIDFRNPEIITYTDNLNDSNNELILIDGEEVLTNL